MRCSAHSSPGATAENQCQIIPAWEVTWHQPASRIFIFPERIGALALSLGISQSAPQNESAPTFCRSSSLADSLRGVVTWSDYFLTNLQVQTVSRSTRSGSPTSQPAINPTIPARVATPGLQPSHLCQLWRREMSGLNKMPAEAPHGETEVTTPTLARRSMSAPLGHLLDTLAANVTGCPYPDGLGVVVNVVVDGYS